MNPAVKFIITSGYCEEIVGDDLARLEAFLYLQKPFHPAQLLQMIRESLDGK